MKKRKVVEPFVYTKYKHNVESPQRYSAPSTIALNSNTYPSEHKSVIISGSNLPITAYRNEFKQKLALNQVIIVMGETGSGSVNN